jgi:selenocysteine lyase/cysteine desulfurase
MTLSRRQFIAASGGAAAALLPSQLQAQDDDPLGVRRDFPVVANGVYLNSAYITPIPTPVAEAGQAFIDRKSRAPIPLDEMLARTDNVRERFARLIGATREEIGFLFATSEGENIVAAALDLKPGDNVVIDELHYTTTFVLYQNLQKSRSIELRVVKHRDGAVAREDFERVVDHRTRLVSVAWVSHQNGFRHDMRPLADVAHAHGALLYTDAIQALGMFPVDVRQAGVDCLTSGTYKWLLGGFGVAPFYVRRELLDRIRVDRFGALHVEKHVDDRYDIYSTARKFDYATLPFCEVYQLGAALAYLARVGVDRIERHTVGLARELRDGLVAQGFRAFTPPNNSSSIVTVYVDRNQAQASELLAKSGVQVTFRENGSQLRLSPALFNTRDDILRFLQLSRIFA